MTRPPIEPVVWRAPSRPARSRRPTGTEPFPDPKVIRLPGEGPEDVVVDAAGRILTGIADGRILRVSPDGRTIETVGRTSGRPLGLHVLPGGDVLVCDAERGLLRLDPETGALSTLAEVAFASNAVAASDGTIYFTSSSRRFGLDHWMGDILEHSGTGRLLCLRPDGTMDTLLDGLYFANGVALTPDESAIIVAETGRYRLTRFPLDGSPPGTWIDNLPGLPDNVSVAADGTLWVALVIARDPRLDLLLRMPPVFRRVLWALPERLRPPPRRTAWVIAVDPHGRVVRDLQRPGDTFAMVTGVARHGDRLYLGSLTEPAICALEVEVSPGT